MGSMLTDFNAALKLWGGLECTTNRVGEHFYSQLQRSGHLERSQDLESVAELGIRTLRCPLLWEQLAPERPGRINWEWADRQMEKLRELGIRPIVGLVHHGSGPRYTSLIDPHFPQKLAAFARAVAMRYPWITDWTPVNEPLTTARFSGLYGHWFPHARDPRVFCRTLLGQVRAIALAMDAVREVNPAARLVQTEDLGETTGTPKVRYQADFDNERRWLSFDLLTGRLDPAGAVWRYLRWAEVAEAELVQFAENPCPPDLIGINHYVTSNRHLDEDVEAYPWAERGGNEEDAYVDCDAVRARRDGFSEPKELLRIAWERYGLPLVISEAHLGCSREEQMRWFAELWSAALAARSGGVPVLAVTAWSLFGAYDWNSLLTRSDGHYEPGAWDLRAPSPRPTALATLFRELVKSGELRSPLLHSPGWWRRPVRFLRTGEGEDGRNTVRGVFAPRNVQGASSSRALLIAGGGGQLGRAFARICYLRGLSYRLLNRSEMDIANADSVSRALQTFKPWAVVNAAGYADVDHAEEERYRCLRENSVGPATLARACCEDGTALLTFSSALVFDGRKAAPYLENDPVAPLSFHGRTKAIAEARVAALHPQALIVRTSDCYGPWGEADFVVRTLQQLRAEVTIAVADDVRFSPTYLPDLVHSSLDLLIDKECGIWHLSNSGEPRSVDVARRIARIAGLDAQLVRGCPHDALGQPAARPRYRALGSERASLMPTWENAMDRFFAESGLLAVDPHRMATRAACAV